MMIKLINQILLAILVNSFAFSQHSKEGQLVQNIHLRNNYINKLNVTNTKRVIKGTPKYRNMIFIGSNYSELTTTKGKGKTGLNVGYYRKSHILKQLSFNYGINYTKKRIDLFNKKIRWSDEYSYSKKANIHLNYNIFELNILANYFFTLNENISIGPVVGVGYAFFPASRSEIDAGENLMQDEPVEEYDYKCGFTDGPPIITNSGQIYHLGTNILIGKYFGMLTYTNYIRTLSSAGVSDIILDEKIHSINMLFGIYF